MNKSKSTDLIHGHIAKSIFWFSVPLLIGNLFQQLYNTVDAYVVGNFVSKEALAAVGASSPIINMLIGFFMGLATGAGVIIAQYFGAGDNGRLKKAVHSSAALTLVMSLLLTVIGIIGTNPMLHAIGIPADVFHDSSTYLMIYFAGISFNLIYNMGSGILRAMGDSKRPLYFLIIACIVNIILDFLFVKYLHMGVAGAALATIISQGVSAVWVLIFLFGKKSTIKIRKQYLKPNWHICLSIMALGISPFVQTATESLLQISFNNQLLIYGGTMAVATMAILMSLWQFITLPLQGLCQGAQPIMSYNYGAKNYTRVRNTFKLVMKVCLGFAFIASGTVMLFSEFFVSIFSSDAQTIVFSSWALRVFLIGSGMFGAQIACQQSFMALGQAKVSVWMAITRKIILLIPLIYIFPYLLGGSSLATSIAGPIASMVHDGSRVFAVLFAEPVSDILAAIITTFMFIRFYKKELKQPDQIIED